MGANLITWSGQTVTPQYDALVFGLSALDGIIYGVDITQSASDPNIINISNGYGIIQGRFFTIEEFSVNVELTTGATYQGQLILHMDLSNADEPISVVVDTGATIRSLIKDADVNIVNGIYEMQLCTFIVDAAAVTDIAITYPKAITFNSIMDHNPIAESETSPATSNHEIDEFLIFENQLYKTAETIISGESLTPGENILPINIADIIGSGALTTTAQTLTGAINELGKVEDLTSGLQWNNTYADSAKTREQKCVKIGHTVTIAATFIVKKVLVDSTPILSGFPRPYGGTIQFVGYNYTKSAPMSMALHANGYVTRWYGGATAVGDVIRCSLTYITEE